MTQVRNVFDLARTAVSNESCWVLQYHLVLDWGKKQRGWRGGDSCGCRVVAAGGMYTFWMGLKPYHHRDHNYWRNKEFGLNRWHWDLLLINQPIPRKCASWCHDQLVWNKVNKATTKEQKLFSGHIWVVNSSCKRFSRSLGENPQKVEAWRTSKWFGRLESFMKYTFNMISKLILFCCPEINIRHWQWW